MRQNISIIGIGNLGLCFALTLENAGYNVLGMDIREDYVQKINSKIFRTPEPGVNVALDKSKNFWATTRISEALEHSDTLFVIVPTNTLPDGHYDHSIIDSVVDQVAAAGSATAVKEFIVSSTTIPGYCDEVAQVLEPIGYRVSYNPEFIAQGNILRDQSAPDMILIGESCKESGNIISSIYEKVCCSNPRICRMPRISAEITKLSVNCFLTTKIAYANMVGDIAFAAGADPDEILNAVGSDSRIGNKFLKYGWGFGGPCLPRDNRALATSADTFGIDAIISKSVDISNADHLENQLQNFFRIAPKDEQVILKSVTYKLDSTIIEESQQLAFAVRVAKEGYSVRIVECSDIINQIRALYGDLFDYESR